jgi:glycine oxidase
MSAKKIVVVGAGAIGLCSALHLVTLGHDVTLIDGDSGDWENFGAAASLAAAGMLAPLAEAAIAPPEGHPRALELMMASLEIWRGMQSKHVRFAGGLILGAELVARASALAEANGLQAQRLSKDAVASRFGLNADEGLYSPDEEATVSPLAQLRAWLAEFRERGGKAHFDIEADTIEKKPWGRAVRCLGGEMFSADQIVLAPGIWARESLIEAAPALSLLRPAKGHLCDVQLSADLSANVHAPGFYLAARGGAEAVLGSTMEFDRDDRRIEPEKVQALRDAARAFLPGTFSDDVGRAWAGVRPMSPDWAPMIGRSGAHGVIVACGHSRNGWLLAPITARIVAAYAEGEEIDPLWQAFAPDRF